jgi:hypothetical protein
LTILYSLPVKDNKKGRVDTRPRKRKTRRPTVKKKKEVCSATIHQKKVDRIVKYIEGEEFYEYTDEELDLIYNFLKKMNITYDKNKMFINLP